MSDLTGVSPMGLIGKPKKQLNLRAQQIIEKFSIPEPNTGCWLWTGMLSKGYGIVSCSGKANKAHRLSYKIHKGDIPEGKQVCHTCDEPSCINPDHLFLGTFQDNMQDKVRKKRQAYGNRIKNSKLNPMSVMIIREAYAKFGPGSQSKMARYFKINQSCISEAIAGKTWKHL